MNGIKTAASRLPKLLLLASTAYAVLNLLHWPLGFTFFTQLSNLYLAAVVLLQLFRPRDTALSVMKFGAVVSIFITFFVYLTVLGPVMPGGLAAAYAQDHAASFCFHLLTPFLAFWDFFLNDALYPYRRRHALLALIPPFLYFLLILALGQLGLRWGKDSSMMAPYPFLDYASPAGWFAFQPGSWLTGIGVFYAVLALLLLFYATARALLFLAGRRRKHRGSPAAVFQQEADPSD